MAPAALSVPVTGIPFGHFPLLGMLFCAPAPPHTWLTLSTALVILGSCGNINNWKPSSIYLKVRFSKVLSTVPWAHEPGQNIVVMWKSFFLADRKQGKEWKPRVKGNLQMPSCSDLLPRSWPHLPKFLQPLQTAAGWDQELKHRSLRGCIYIHTTTELSTISLGKAPPQPPTPTSLVHTCRMTLLPHSGSQPNGFHPCPSMPSCFYLSEGHVVIYLTKLFTVSSIV